MAKELHSTIQRNLVSKKKNQKEGGDVKKEGGEGKEEGRRRKGRRRREQENKNGKNFPNMRRENGQN